MNKANIKQFKLTNNLLRNKKLVDLYQIVRESLRISEPKYSIKNLEKFYQQKMGERTDSVTNGSDSVIFFEMWRESGENENSQLLKDIEQYNLQDVRSTYFLRDWLINVAKLNGVAIGVGMETDRKFSGEMSEQAKRYAKELGIITHKLNKEIKESETNDSLRRT